MSEDELMEPLQKNMEREKVYYANSAFILREIAGESVLVSIGSGVADFCGIIHLNPSAKILWKSLQRGASKNELIRELQKYFQVSEEKAAEDVEKSLTLLGEKGMISCE